MDLPVNLAYHEIVASKGQTNLYTIGYGGSKKDEIYKFSCTNSITNCSWTQILTKLRHGRWETVAMSISDTLANKLCYSLPRIIIKTADDEVYADTKDDLYLEVCDTNNDSTCCKETFDGPFETGAENIFTFNAEFQKCLESSKKLFYFVGLTGNDGWKSNELKIYFDGSTEEVCTLDGDEWLDGDDTVGYKPKLPLKCDAFGKILSYRIYFFQR